MQRLKQKNKTSNLLFKILAAVFLTSAIFAVYAQFSSAEKREFAEAADLPRGALVYAQARDLPALLKLWNASAFKTRYEKSVNYEQFQNRHLFLKLLSRLDEFQNAAGFALDSAAIIGATENRAAAAIYDIGRLEFVFVAPLSENAFAATAFAQNREQFEERALENGAIYYAQNVEADRGRQKQKILFANFKGRFVLSTSEALLLRTLANINGNEKKDRLTDEPTFDVLTMRATPQLFTVWVNQTALNNDWYFKKYWLMRNAEDLKNIRAGIFDFRLENGKLTELREFLLAENVRENQAVSAEDAARLQGFIRAETPFFRLQSVRGNSARAAILARNSLLDELEKWQPEKRAGRWSSYDSFDYDEHYYSDGSEYETEINEPDEDQKKTEKPLIQAREEDLQKQLERIFADAQASAVVSATSPKVLANPLFVEFRKTAVFSLDAPAKLDRAMLENIIAQMIENRLTVAESAAALKWENREENNAQWRELKLPSLGWSIGYAVADGVLILTNNAETMKQTLAAKAQNSSKDAPADFDELTVIRLDRRAEAFDSVMTKLDEPKRKKQAEAKESDDNRSADFFTGNIASLLDSAADVSRVEIKRKASAEFMREEIEVFFK